MVSSCETDAEIIDMVYACQQSIDTLDYWEQEFIKQASHKLDDDYDLSSNQLDMLTEIYKRVVFE
ncbi:hypothetical protein SAMN05216302_101137 [Nitrosomonas aestuarii]|uniref:Uncharacterized protein n=1 Tax=Nitrosomonas aestuarii TaxID=52441 RepID=A0A1I4B4Q0_9PROT|nr:hypothetical protein [Nitrosomonas aestuarii]SFK63882.1 hypothetical protein SAMN05216302_101137 [Nitrosomonas aestuarii]